MCNLYANSFMCKLVFKTQYNHCILLLYLIYLQKKPAAEVFFTSSAKLRLIMGLT